MQENFTSLDTDTFDDEFIYGELLYLDRLDENAKEKDATALSLHSNEFDSHEKEDVLSNTRLDSYIDEIVELILKDFIMSWLSNFTWEKESGKLVALARLTPIR